MDAKIADKRRAQNETSVEIAAFGLERLDRLNSRCQGPVP